MPDAAQSPELLEQRTSFDPLKREVQTLELVQKDLSIVDELDLVFIMDTTGSMESQIEAIADSMIGVAAGIGSTFPSVRYAVITFKDEDETEVATDGFTDLATAQAVIDGLVAEGGDDAAENSFGAMYLGAKLPFREGSVRVMILITDVESHERGKTFEQCRTALLRSNSVLFYGLSFSDEWFEQLADDTGGDYIAGGTSEEITTQIVDKINGLADPVAPPVYLVNDNVPFTATLETGEEVEFVNRSFAINVSTSGEDGVPSIDLTMDNTDFAVSRFLAKARNFNLPLQATLRIYLSDDPSGPQINPPFRLFATDFEIKGTTVGCQVRFVDLLNAPFPNAFYTADRCPSLQ